MTKRNFDSTKPPLYIVDGKEMMDIESTFKVDPETIQSIDVYKGEKAIMLYGEKAKNGAVVITLKKK